MIRNELIIKEMRLEAGGTLSPAVIVYHTSKKAWTPGEKVVWICHALTANSNPEEWWPDLIGPGLCIDTERDFVVCFNTLCSPYGSSSPASVNPATGRPYLLDFPAVTIRDIAAAGLAVRERLGLAAVDLLVGSSLGGFTAFEMALAAPGVFRHQVYIATAPRVSPWLTAMNEAQRMAIEADPTFRAAGSTEGGLAGLRCARAQGLVSYRSFAGYLRTQYEEDPDTLFAGRAASYERYQGEKLVRRGFDAYSYWYLTRALDSHNAGRGRGGLAAALQTLRGDIHVVDIDTDNLFPPEEADAYAALIPGVVRHTITSQFGHDGFLLEHGQIAGILTPLLRP